MLVQNVIMLFMRNTVLMIVVGVLLLLTGYWFFSSRTSDLPATTIENSESENESDLMVAESATIMAPGSYTADTETSLVTWQAGKPAIAGYVHTGAFAIDSGSINLSESDITGEFVIDVESLKVTSLGGGKVGQESTLEGHLKSDKFLDTETYSTATFVITDVSPKVLPGPSASEYTATGDLTLKGQTKEVSFPMRVTVVSESKVRVDADIALNRTEWGINSGSASVAEKITDNIIGDIVNMNLVVELEK